MAVPDFQTLMLPLLTALKDGTARTLSEVAEQLAVEFKLTEDDRATRLPSGGQLLFENRVGWSRTYLRKAGLIDAPARGQVIITTEGTAVLASKPSKVDVKMLKKYPAFVEFHGKGSKGAGGESGPTVESEAASRTPLEQLEASHLVLRAELADELLQKVAKCSPKFFEDLVIDLLVAMGYGGSRADAGQSIGRSGDEGIDGIIKEDKLGLDVVYVQAKRWQGAVGRPVVQAFAGSLEGHRARKGVMITTSSFTQEAREYVTKIEKKIALIDGATLGKLMMDHDVGVSVRGTYLVKKLDLEYFEGE